MSIGTPVLLGTGGYFGSASFDAFTTGASVPAGGNILIDVLVAGAAVTGITDAAGRAYTLDASGLDANGVGHYLLTSRGGAALASGSTITINYFSAQFWHGWSAWYIPSTTPLLLDATAGQAGTSTIFPGTGTASITNQPAILWATFTAYESTHTSDTLTPAGGYTGVTGAVAVSGAASISLFPTYEMIAATGFFSENGQLGNTCDSYVGLIASYYEAAVLPAKATIISQAVKHAAYR